jgi:hypothetical protein
MKPKIILQSILHSGKLPIILKKFFSDAGDLEKSFTFAPILRGGAEVARWAHNPKVIGSNPVPATTKPQHEVLGFFFSAKASSLLEG